jgi:hypothetical protein
VRTPRVTLWILRLLLAAHLLAVLAQGVLAGRYMTGDLDAIATHEHLGSRLLLVAAVVIGSALAYVVIMRGRWWVLVSAVLLFLADWAEITIGRLRGLDVHIPLGMALAVGATLFAVWAWSPAAARPRESRRARVGAGAR